LGEKRKKKKKKLKKSKKGAFGNPVEKKKTKGDRQGIVFR